MPVQNYLCIVPTLFFNIIVHMKSSYELAMERLNKAAPSVKLTEAQKQELADMDSQYAAKIAAREIAMQAEIQRCEKDGNMEKAMETRQQLAADRRKLQAELEEKKERVRAGK